MVRNICITGILGDGLFKQHGTLEACCSPGGGKLGKEQLQEGGQLKTRQASAECHAGSTIRSDAWFVPAIHHRNNTEETRCFEQGDN